MRKLAGPLAALVATLYLTLSVSAAACLLAHASPSRTSHHHHDTSGVAHSALCLWVCQAQPTVDLPATALPATFLHVVALLLLGGMVLLSTPFNLPRQSRAPPHR
ncbi:MAG: hypothetical protein OJF50_000259 [Nitrospira sp.]|nr:hypothetical protein [Nitrospira sp.]